MGKEGNDGTKAAKVAEARRRFAEMERGQCARIREAARKDYEEWLRLEAGKAKLVGSDGRPLTRLRRTTVMATSPFGPVEVEVKKGYDRAAGRWVCPAKERLGLVKKKDVTPEAEASVATLAVEARSYGAAERLSLRLLGFSISDTTINDRVVDGVGGAGMPEPPLPDGRGDGIVAEADGWMARFREDGWAKDGRKDGQCAYAWHEVRSGVAYFADDCMDVSEGRREIAWKLPVTAFPGDDANALGATLYEAACHLGYRKCQRACWVSDGGKPLWGQYKMRFSRGKNHAMGLLDLYHNMEHVSAFALDLFDGDAEKAARWAGDSKTMLKEKGGRDFLRRVERAIRKHGKNDAAKRKRLDEAAQYFRDHRRHMNYPLASKLGFPVGSGAMESQCSQFQGRFKRTGQYWSRKGFRALIVAFIWNSVDMLDQLMAA